MKVLTLKDKILNLPAKKKAIIRRYLMLYADVTVPPDQLVTGIAEIWGQAATDSELVTYLELIDYFYSDSSDQECLSDDERSYLCEYLANQVGLSSESSDLRLNLPAKCFLLECPNGEYVIIEVKGTKDSSQFDLNGWKCSQCNGKFANHKIIHRAINFEGALP